MASDKPKTKRGSKPRADRRTIKTTVSVALAPAETDWIDAYGAETMPGESRSAVFRGLLRIARAAVEAGRT